jgi:hypothetical protein
VRAGVRSHHTSRDRGRDGGGWVRLEVGSADLGSEWAETAGAGESGSDDVEGGRGSAGALWEGGGSRRRRRRAGDEPLNL